MYQVLREVKTLALLNHSNVVRYHSAWIERNECDPDSPALTPTNNNNIHNIEESPVVDDEDDDYSSDDEISPLSDDVWSDDSEDMEQFNPFKIDDDIWPTTSANNTSASANPPLLKESHQLLSHKKPVPITPQNFNAPLHLKPQGTSTRTNRTTQRKRRSDNITTLFIVMQLCSTTLAQWLDRRPPGMVDTKQNIYIFHQISI